MTELLIFVILETKLNISFVIYLAAYFTKNPSYANTKNVKTTFQYFESTINYGITYESNG